MSSWGAAVMDGSYGIGSDSASGHTLARKPRRVVVLARVQGSVGASLATNLKGRLHNTSLPLTSGLLPQFEAVVNSIHAIEERKVTMDHGLVRVQILRKAKQAELSFDESKRRGPDARGDIQGFSVFDNGIGFTDENMTSFSTLDSDYKMLRGGRGVGRLLWLKAFGSVNIESVFRDGPTSAKTSPTMRPASENI